MRFKQHTKHKTRPKLLTLIMSILLAFSMTIPMIQYNTLEVQATAGDMGSEDSSAATGTYDGGPMAERTGWLFYCIDLSNSQVTSTMATTSYGEIVDRDGKSLPSSNVILTSRYGVTAANLDIGCDWGPPYDTSCNGLGDEVKDFMLSTGAGGNAKAYNLIERAFGQSYAEQWNNREVYLVFEPFYWYNALAGNGKQVGWYCTTAYYWGAIHKKLGCPETGMAFFKKYTNKVWPTCVKLDGSAETAALGFTPVSGEQTNTAMATFSVGAGIGMVWNGGSVKDHQTTCDETQGGVPSKPAEESTGVYRIVKSYRIYNLDTGAYTNVGTYYKPDSSPNITIEDESEYKLVEWRTSSTFDSSVPGKGWEQKVPAVVRRTGNSPGEIVLSSPETTLYILLEKPEKDPTPVNGKADFIISQSTITRKIKISHPDGAGLTLMKDVEFKWRSEAHKYSCSHHHSWKSGTDKDGKDTYDSHDVSCTWGQWYDNSVNFSLKNSQSLNYPDIVATKAGWEAVTFTGLSSYTKRNVPKTRTIVKTGSTFGIKDYDYSCVLLRGKDKLTVASWKNTDLNKSEANSYLASVSSSGFSIGNSATGSRKTSLYYDSFIADFVDDSLDLETTYQTTSGVSCHGQENCGKKDNTRTYALLKSPYLHLDVGVKVETYSGSQSEGSLDTTCDSTPTSYSAFSGLSALSSKDMVRGIEVPSGANLSFRPYIQMNYDIQTAKHEAYGSSTTNHKTAYVLGNIQRVMAPNDYAEVSWKSRDADKPNLTLDSLQWSTHSSAVDFISTKLGQDKLSKFTVLPGGATLNLTIKESDRQQVQATTYQCVVDGSGKTQIDNAGGEYTGLEITDAETSHRAYVDSVINGLEKLNVEQWVTNDLSKVNSSTIEKSSTNVWNISGSSMVEWESNLKAAGHSNQTASMEYKYYFSADGGRPEAPASEGDLDVEELNTVTKKYTFFTNTYGEIRYTVDDVNPNTGGNERKGNLANDSIADAINKRTHVVDKLRAAVEQGTGNDPSGRSKTGTAWYNEAFDGVTVYVQTTTLSVGYIDPASRSCVLDPKLTQTQDNQNDMFNKDKYNMSQYRTKPYSDEYAIADAVGTFKNTTVYMKEMKDLFFSRKFFIPNATVDDLH